MTRQQDAQAYAARLLAKGPPRTAAASASASEQRPLPDSRLVSYAPYQRHQRLSPPQKFLVRQSLPLPALHCLIVIIQERPSLISSYITSLHLHLRIALGSKHSTCDPSRHWHKKCDMQWSGTSERSPPDSVFLFGWNI